jgi:hypothetical protein
MEENGTMREDLALPKGTDEAEKLAELIKNEFADGKEIVLSVLKASEPAGHTASKHADGASMGRIWAGACCGLMACHAVCKGTGIDQR